MNPHVDCEITALSKCLGTDAAFVRFDASVETFMFSQVTVHGEGLLTEAAAEWFLAGMHPHVSIQG